MGRDATKAMGNVWYEARKEAAIYNDRLASREGAAEMLGMSVSAVADAELGLCIIDGKLTLVDFKCTAAFNEMTCGVQLEAYSQALKSHGINVENKLILHLKKDGNYAVHPFLTNDVKRWRVFGSLKCVHDYIQSYK